MYFQIYRKRFIIENVKSIFIFKEFVEPWKSEVSTFGVCL